MGRKSKIPYELKVINVEEYIKGNKSASELASTLGISIEQFRRWVHKYNVTGAAGLRTHPKNRSYSTEVKHSSVNDYISGKGSLCDICNKYNISSLSVLQGWILKYNNSHNKWKSHNTKENKIMTKGRKTTYKERVEIVAFCIENNDNYQLTSDKYKISYQQVYTWVRKYKENGYESLKDNRGKRKNIDQISEAEKLNAQIRLLKAKNKQLEMENNFLKKLEEIERRG
ncbi:helix-turn-helix domain-containing protein [Terrisporobacter sp.]|uniref:helix-turn-helix domain-containing protein n=1 Tax=Terrisporobacter sp. TaxID=1965305 RepID=UPI00260335EB|nr:helix-turn-helix domain-containing protein [Terrisporobacter sp.]